MTISATCPGFYLIQGGTFMWSRWDFHMIEIVYLRCPFVHREFQQVLMIATQDWDTFTF